MADGYDLEDWERLNFTWLWKLQTVHGKDALYFYDTIMCRTLTLFMHGTLNRGNTARGMEFCDVFSQSLLTAGPSECILFAFVDKEGKANKNGRTEHCGMLRHRDWKKCPVGGLAFWLFYLWHICRREGDEDIPPFDVTRRQSW